MRERSASHGIRYAGPKAAKLGNPGGHTQVGNGAQSLALYGPRKSPDAGARAGLPPDPVRTLPTTAPGPMYDDCLPTLRKHGQHPYLTIGHFLLTPQERRFPNAQL